jgi:hypothetical protein
MPFENWTPHVLVSGPQCKTLFKPCLHHISYCHWLAQVTWPSRVTLEGDYMGAWELKLPTIIHPSFSFSSPPVG